MYSLLRMYKGLPQKGIELKNGEVAMTAQIVKNSSIGNDEQIREINRALKKQNGRLSVIIPVFLLLAGIAALAFFGKKFDFSDKRILIVSGIILFILFVLWEIVAYVKSKRFATDFYGKMLPSVLKKAYAAYTPRTGNPDPLFFDSAETRRFPTTVTFLVLTMNDSSFDAQGIYRIERQYFKADSLGDKDNDESGQYSLSQDLIWKIRLRKRIPFRLSLQTASGSVGETVFGIFGKICDRLTKNGMQDVKIDDEAFNKSFRVRSDDVILAKSFLEAHVKQLTELRNNMGRFSLEYADDMLTLSFTDFAPVDAKDTNGVRRTGLPDELSAVRIADSARKLDFLADRFRSFI